MVKGPNKYMKCSITLKANDSFDLMKLLNTPMAHLHWTRQLPIINEKEKIS